MATAEEYAAEVLGGAIEEFEVRARYARADRQLANGGQEQPDCASTYRLAAQYLRDLQTAGSDFVTADYLPGDLPGAPQPNNPGYRPEYKELEEARLNAAMFLGASLDVPLNQSHIPACAVLWLAAEVRVMRLERALER